MKKNFLKTIFILSLFLVLAKPIICQTEWDVDPMGGGDFTTLSAAITSSSVMPGDILNVFGTLTEANITVNKDLTIRGEGQNMTIVQASANRGDASGRVFFIEANQTVTIQDMTIQHGRELSSDRVFGGGIFCNSGSNVRLERVTVQKNDIFTTNSSNRSGSRGGGIFGQDDGVTIYIEDCLITDNYSDGRGGGIAFGTVTIGEFFDIDIINSTISYNEANEDYNGGDGGGLTTQLLNSTMDVTGCLFLGNKAGDDGGGVSALTNGINFPANFTNCTFSGNTCGKSALRAEGGGMQANYNTVTITNCTFTNNTLTSRDNDIADEEGAGLWVNDESTTNLINCIISNNTQHDGSSEDLFLAGGLSTNVRNLVVSCAGDVSCPVFYKTSGANLEALAANGGPTLTHALLAGSEAINEGDAGTAPANDQRGYPRNVGDPDIGAFEFGASPPVPPGPEMLLEDADGSEIVNGDDSPSVDESTDFGAANINGGSMVRTFTIKNTGDADLNLTGMPNAVAISGSSAFMISASVGSTTISGPSGSTTFQVTFDPSESDCSTQTATVSIANNDSDEDPYTFDVQGTPVDNIAPEITCPVDITKSNDAGECSAVVLFSAIGSDNCVGFTLDYTQLSGAIFDVGTTMVTATATDNAGNTSTCTFDVTVNDTEAPAITCPTNVTAQATAASCMPLVNDIAPTTSDNCVMNPGITYETTGATMTSGSGDLSGNTFAVGATSVSYTATDDAMNTATCSFMVTVEDNTACGCESPQPGDTCDDMDEGTINDMIQADCSCMGIVVCDIVINSVIVTSETCDGDNDGTITINAACTTCAGILYSIDGGATTQMSNTFVGLMPGTYSPYVEDSGEASCNDNNSGMDVTVAVGAALPSGPIAGTTSKEFCQNDELAASLANTGVNVTNSLSADEKVVWVLQAVPAGSIHNVGDEFTTDNCGDGFKDFGELAVANTSKVIRVNDPDSGPVGTYTFDAYIMNCVTGCISGTISGFSITVYAAPTVEILADPDGDLCVGQMGVQYSTTITSTDGGTYSYLWCAYNSGDGSGTCFNGFDNNTAAMPTRDWTSSVGAKSVGVTVTSDVAGCEAEDLYSFEVVAPTMVACPMDMMGTLETDDVTLNCAATISWDHPEVIPGPCDPVVLTITISGGSVSEGPTTVTPGDPYTYTFEELGVFTVTYDLVDAIGNASSCSFTITVDGLPCGFVDNGGIGCADDMNSSGFDPATGIFTLTANNCALTGWPYNSDQSAIVFSELCGDGEIIARVTGVSGTGFAGVMMRDSEDPAAPMVAMGTNMVNRVLKQVRTLPAYPAFPQLVLAYDQVWVRLSRSGNQFMGFASTDGVSWVPYINQQLFMSNNCLRVGLFTYSEKPGNPITATFDNVFITGVATPLAPGGQSLELFKSSKVYHRVNLYPNPAASQVTLELGELAGQAAEIRIFNTIGQLVKQVRFDEVQFSEQLNIADLDTGVYNIVIKAGARLISERLVIARP